MTAPGRALRPYLAAGADVLAPAELSRHLRDFQRHGQDGQLRFQRCAACGYLRYPAAGCCPQCLHPVADWVADSGAGTVWSFCVYRRAFHPAFAGLLPYVVALVELDSGPRLVTNLPDLPPERVRIGLRGRAVPYPLPDGGSLVYFLAAPATEPATGGDHAD